MDMDRITESFVLFCFFFFPLSFWRLSFVYFASFFLSALRHVARYRGVWSFLTQVSWIRGVVVVGGCGMEIVISGGGLRGWEWK